MTTIIRYIGSPLRVNRGRKNLDVSGRGVARINAGEPKRIEAAIKRGDDVQVTGFRGGVLHLFSHWVPLSVPEAWVEIVDGEGGSGVVIVHECQNGQGALMVTGGVVK